MGETALGIDPHRGDARVFSAQNVGGQAVAHHDGLLGVKVRDTGEAGVKKFFRGLVEAQLLRDEDRLKEAVQVGAGQSACLNGCSAVAGEKQTVFLAQAGYRFLGAGEEIVSDSEIFFVAAGALHRVRRYAQLPEQRREPADQHLLPGQLSLLQLLPVPKVDSVIQ